MVTNIHVNVVIREWMTMCARASMCVCACENRWSAHARPAIRLANQLSYNDEKFRCSLLHGKGLKLKDQAGFEA
jgi:hypothetical protein